METTARFPEDLAANLRLVEALAPAHCSGCMGYHLARARRRLKAGSPDALDRTETIQLLRTCLGQASHGAVDIVIAGVGDTNLLATCAEAMPDLAKVRFTVLDRCRTPLVLCEAFARRHGLNVETSQVEVGAPDAAFPADIILVHSLLRFLPRSAHRAVMLALRRWLKPEGMILFSHRLMAGDVMTESCYLAEYESAGPILNLFQEVGLQVVSSLEPVEQSGPRHRFLALLKQG
ncbi:class I SAM-dependent methyltransferase [Dongia deserti]|uniref:class I SAM-dependent methyltransferase n=1 Tax=Dongia deserti TaxID=2268030 RepID=UPI0013C4F28C|nr:class I SAM-dependent methyltransferase [Dongia deserti]